MGVQFVISKCRKTLGHTTFDRVSRKDIMSRDTSTEETLNLTRKNKNRRAQRSYWAMVRWLETSPEMGTTGMELTLENLLSPLREGAPESELPELLSLPETED